MDWVEHCRGNWDGTNEIIYKDSNKSGWNIRLEIKRNQTRCDFYLKNQQYVDVIPGNGIASIKQLKLFLQWELVGFADHVRPEGLGNKFKARNALPAVLMPPPPVPQSRLPRVPSVDGEQPADEEPAAESPRPVNRGIKRQLTATELLIQRWDQEVTPQCYPKLGFRAGNLGEANVTLLQLNLFLKENEHRTDLTETERPRRSSSSAWFPSCHKWHASSRRPWTRPARSSRRCTPILLAWQMSATLAHPLLPTPSTDQTPRTSMTSRRARSWRTCRTSSSKRPRL